MDEDFTVGVEDFGLGDEAEVAVVLEDGEVPCPGFLEFAHDAVHGVVDVDEGGGGGHVVADVGGGVHVGVEHYFADVVEGDDAEEVVVAVEDGEEVAGGAGDDFDEVAKGVVDVDGEEVGFDDFVEFHEGEDGLVLVVGEEVAFLGETTGVDGVGFHAAARDVAEDGGEHEGEEEGVAAGDFRDEEHGGEGGFHDASHDASHAGQDKVTLGEGVDAAEVDEGGEEVAGDAAGEEAGGEDATDAAAAVGEGGGAYFDEEEAGDEEEEDPGVVAEVEEVGVVEYVGGLACHEGVEGGVSLAVEGGEDEDDETEEGAPDEHFLEGMGDTLEELLDAEVGPHEVDGDEAGEEAEDDVVGEVGHGEAIGDLVGEDESVAHEEVGDDVGGDGGEHEGDEGGHGEVEHEYFHGEDDAGDGCLEDAGDGAGGAAPDHEGHDFVVHVEEAGEAGTDGGAGEDDGGLRADGAAEADGEGTGDHGGVVVVGLDETVLAGDGVEDFGDAVADVVLDAVADEEVGEEDADEGADEEYPATAVELEVFRDPGVGEVDHVFEEDAGQAGDDADEDAEEDDELSFLDVADAPGEEAGE